MELGLLSKAIPVFQFIYNVMIKITNLEQKDLEKITVQDAVSLMIYYKATFENNIAIGEIEDGDLLATDFIIERKKQVDKKEVVKIKGKNFSPFLVLSKAIEAEKMALAVNGNELAYLSLYAFGACYVGRVRDGVNHILNTPDLDIQQGLNQLNEMIGRVGAIRIGFPKFKGRRRFSIIAQKSDGEEVRAYALPFQDTHFYDYGF
jgi:hypothetical protein